MSQLFRNTTVTLRRPRYGPGARAELKAAPFQRPHEDAEDQDQAGRDRREADRTADDRGARLFGLHGCGPGTLGHGDRVAQYKEEP